MSRLGDKYQKVSPLCMVSTRKILGFTVTDGATHCNDISLGNCQQPMGMSATETNFRRFKISIYWSHGRWKMEDRSK